jgi:predicted amidohydrolase
MQDLTITLVQIATRWHNPEANRAMIAKQLLNANPATDLIVLPEMFTTGFTMDTKSQAEEEGGTTSRWLQEQAAQYNCVITGSIIIKKETRYFNRLLWVEPDGNISFYDKRHLFRMAGEHRYFSEGNMVQTFGLQGWRIRVAVCYDLRFPVWSRNILTNGELDYDLSLFVANWPAARISAWDILLKARGVENLSYCIGVNRTGVDGEGIQYNGHSACYDFKGDERVSLDEKEMIKSVSLSKNDLENYRAKFPAFKDADQFNLNY